MQITGRSSWVVSADHPIDQSRSIDSGSVEPPPPINAKDYNLQWRASEFGQERLFAFFKGSSAFLQRADPGAGECPKTSRRRTHHLNVQTLSPEDENRLDDVIADKEELEPMKLLIEGILPEDYDGEITPEIVALLIERYTIAVGDPRCVRVAGARPEGIYLFDLVLEGSGGFIVRSGHDWAGQDDSVYDQVDGVGALLDGGPDGLVAYDDFREAVADIGAWGQAQNPACRFFVRTRPNHQDLDLYQRQLQAVERQFYALKLPREQGAGESDDENADAELGEADEDDEDEEAVEEEE